MRATPRWPTASSTRTSRRGRSPQRERRWANPCPRGRPPARPPRGAARRARRLCYPRPREGRSRGSPRGTARLPRRRRPRRRRNVPGTGGGHPLPRWGARRCHRRRNCSCFSAGRLRSVRGRASRPGRPQAAPLLSLSWCPPHGAGARRGRSGTAWLGGGPVLRSPRRPAGGRGRSRRRAVT